MFEVNLFSMPSYPVTNAQFAKFIAVGGYEQKKYWTEAGWQQREQEKWTEPRYWQDKKWNGADYPVVGVTWYEAVAFCQWLTDAVGADDGTPITLPTEQQWQRAAQGDAGWVYPWGNAFDKNKANTKESGIIHTTPVTQYPQGSSYYGVQDMSGNVWEWCRTDYNTGSKDLNGTYNRVMRGGSWFVDQNFARAKFCGGYFLDACHDDLGFRLVVSSPISSGR